MRTKINKRKKNQLPFYRFLFFVELKQINEKQKSTSSLSKLINEIAESNLCLASSKIGNGERGTGIWERGISERRNL